MLTVFAAFGIVAVIAMSCALVFIAVKLSETSSQSFQTLDRAHTRWVQQTERLLDRLSTRNWEEYAALKSLDEGGDEGFYAPGEQGEGGEVRQQVRSWGGLRDIGPIPGHDSDEEKLLSEDFGDDDEPRRSVG